MVHKKPFWPELLDLFICSRASASSSNVADPKELGSDDEWLFLEIDGQINKMDNIVFLDLLEEIKKKTKEKYRQLPDRDYIVFSVVSAMIWRRPTRYVYSQNPNETDVPLDLTELEEKRLIDIIVGLKNDLPAPHKYRADSLIFDLTGK